MDRFCLTWCFISSLWDLSGSRGYGGKVQTEVFHKPDQRQMSLSVAQFVRPPLLRIRRHEESGLRKGPCAGDAGMHRAARLQLINWVEIRSLVIPSSLFGNMNSATLDCTHVKCTQALCVIKGTDY